MSESPQASSEHITDATAQFVADLAAEFLILLGAPRTSIEVQTDPADEDGYAEMEAHVQKHLMKLWLCAEWEQRDWRANGRTILHECIHYLHAGQDRILREELQQRLYGKEWWNVLRDIMHREYEMFVDQMTTTLWESLDCEKRLKQLHKAAKYPVATK